MNFGLAKNSTTIAPTAKPRIGSHIDCAIAAVKPSSTCGGSPPEPPLACSAACVSKPGSSAASRAFSTAAIAALPSTDPICRVVL